MPIKNLLPYILMLLPSLIMAQNLNSDKEKGVFMSKCYTLGVYLVYKAGSEISAEDKKRLTNWALNVSANAEKHISKSEFKAISQKEIEYLTGKSDDAYLMRQTKQCTSVLGTW